MPPALAANLDARTTRAISSRAGIWRAKFLHVLARNGISTVSTMVDTARLPIRFLYRGESGALALPGNCCRLALIKKTAEGVSLENSVFQGDAAECQSRVVSMMHNSERIAIEGLSLEVIARLCFQHNYRWRFGDNTGNSIRFVVEPSDELKHSLLDLEKSTPAPS